MKSVFQRVQRDFFRWRYSQVARQVLNTAPIQQGKIPFVLLSMVQQRDILSYLVAVKSFVCYANPVRIIVVCDPSITKADREILKSHIPHIELHSAMDFIHPDIPRGGTWERLFAISVFVKQNYVVQLDADTVTCQPLPEVLESIQSQAAFVLGESPQQQLLSLQDTSENAHSKMRPLAHIQTLAEAAIAEIGLSKDARYVRGCSGFTGFPPDSEMQEKMLDFSRRMKRRLEDGWSRWGTEQVTSNYLAANASGASVLPFPKYGTPDLATEETVFFHFIGSMRFLNPKYEITSKKVMKSFNVIDARIGEFAK